MFSRFPFVTLVCCVLAAVVVFGFARVCSPERRTDTRDFSVSSERIQDRFSILCRVDFFGYNKIRSKVVLTMSEQQRVKTPDRLGAGKYRAD
ncbi:MAG: hypothetical protein A2168_07290 [Planctomycetes bacterium RBG_13_50_24]|nr:MAG: hypothetical protein A2168_07290 [Planctomycetes bacterium RBG_13_50_24]